MGLYINTNTQSIFAQRSVTSATSDLQGNIEKLSTGFRINKAADDAAGLSISEKFTSQIRGLEKAEKNIGDGISMLQTAEGAIGIIQDNVQRIRELVVQASNGTNSENELAAMQREVNELVNTIGDITTETEFNENFLLNGSITNVALQTGSGDGQTTTVSFNDKDTRIDQTGAGSIGENAVALNTLAVGSTSVNTVAGGGAGTATGLDDIDDMIGNLSRMRSELGAAQNSLESKAEFLNVAKENALASRSRIRDVDVASESSDMLKNQILQQSAASMLSQANATPQLALNLLP